MTVAIDNSSGSSSQLGEASPHQTSGRNSGLRSWFLAAAPALIVLVASWDYRWLQDDAFINFRIIDNLLAGHGPVFNVGERVETYSDPLWLFTVALMHGVLPFASLEWISVIAGIACGVGGVLVGGRAIQRLGASRGDQLVVPVGLFVFSMVAGVWEYVTGGLEMGMVFLWIGISFWLLVRLESRRTGAHVVAFVIGLGVLIRPELILEAGVFLFSMIAVVAASGWCGPMGRIRRYGTPLVAAAALPIGYELFRMAYFGMVVANTALAKSAGSSWWGQGFTYLWNFVAPYMLWLPFLLMLPLVGPRVVRWWRSHDRIGILVLVTPLAGGLLDVLYVVHVGGDYQHARLLLPAFFAICLSLYFEVDQLRTLAVLPALGIVLWSVACIGWLRFDPEHAPFQGIHGISNARDAWVKEVQGAAPMDLSSYRQFAQPAYEYRGLAEGASRQDRQVMIIATNAFYPLSGQVIAPASTNLPQHAIVYVVEIGVRGLVSGPDVYVFDAQSLANPIGAHTSVGHGTRPGGKVVDPVWMVGRFGSRTARVPLSVASPSAIADARAAVSCGTLGAYLHAITAPLTWSLAWSNFTHATRFTSLSFSPDPSVARHQLCRDTSDLHGEQKESGRTAANS